MREVNLSNINNQMFEEVGEIINENSVDETVWKTYVEYLQYIEVKVKKLRGYLYLTHKEGIFTNKLVDNQYKFRYKPD